MLLGSTFRTVCTRSMRAGSGLCARRLLRSARLVAVLQDLCGPKIRAGKMLLPTPHVALNDEVTLGGAGGGGVSGGRDPA